MYVAVILRIQYVETLLIFNLGSTLYSSKHELTKESLLKSCPAVQHKFEISIANLCIN